MSNWKPIETAPKDGAIIWLYWPRYKCETYGIEEHAGVYRGAWKQNMRLARAYANDEPTPNAEELEARGYREWYFSDELGEFDDYDLALPEHAPTHWQPYIVPEPPSAT